MMINNFLGKQFPIIQAPMSAVQDSAVAISFSNCSGLGSLPYAILTSEKLRAELAFFKSQTKNLFNLIFFCYHQPKVFFDREQKWLKILEPYFNEFSLSSANIQNGSDRGFSEK